MKKTYTKPEIFFESFMLNENIASCAFKINSADIEQCDATIDNESFFTQKGICTFTPPNPDDKPCYHIPTSGVNFFTS